MELTSQNENIKINKDMLYRLIQEMKEFRKLIPKDDTKNLIRRHKLKMEYLLLDRLLIDNGIDKMVIKINHEKTNMMMVNALIKEDKNE